MNPISLTRLATMKLAPLAACLASALMLAPARATHSTPRPGSPSASITNCDDHGSGSLRDVVASAQEGDTVDLSPLANLCTMTPATLTLTTGEIAVAQDDLLLFGPSDRTVRISGGGHSRVFNHSGSGTFSIGNVTISDGSYVAGAVANGGCIYSAGSVELYRSSVVSCVISATATGGVAQGGGIYTLHGTYLTLSTVSGNRIDTTSQGFRCGAGVHAHDLSSVYTTISDNTMPGGSTSGYGGGACVLQDALIGVSTVSYNSAPQAGGGIVATNALLVESTLSHNSAGQGGSIYATRATLLNSTIAFNSSGVSTTFLSATSSIFATNGPGDISTPTSNVTGSDNLVTSPGSLSMPFVVSTSDPLLTPLQYNGGRTKTHALKTGSPAIGKGNNGAAMAVNDQRGVGYPRQTQRPTGLETDIGAVEHGDRIFVDGFELFP